MPVATNGGVSLHYGTDGDGETVAFVPDLGCGAWLWAWQAPAVAGPFEAVVWEMRATGRSDAPAGPYTVAELAADLEAVLADAGARRAHLVGAGLGGMVALRHALDYGRAATLSLLGTAANGGAFDADPLLSGPGDLDGLLSGGFVEERPDEIERIVAWRREEDAGPEAKAAQAAAVEGFDLRGRLHEVTVPALVVHGAADAVVAPEAGEALADALPRGEFEGFEAGPHFVFVERSRLVTDRLVGFLEGHVG